jgi:hypothetical protein
MSATTASALPAAAAATVAKDVIASNRAARGAQPRAGEETKLQGDPEGGALRGGSCGEARLWLLVMESRHRPRQNLPYQHTSPEPQISETPKLDERHERNSYV